jgi:hypothetical protein
MATFEAILRGPKQGDPRFKFTSTDNSGFIGRADESLNEWSNG